MRKVCVFTSTRADYGILYGLIKELHSNVNIELQLLVTGTHLEKKYGETIRFIREDGFLISKEVKLNFEDNSVLGVCKAQGDSIYQFAKAVNDLGPDICVVLGDRFEALSFAIACTHLGIPLAHLHGGELSLGAVDDVFRHSITKLSYLHFTIADVYKDRVIQMGEEPERVYQLGALGVENIPKLATLRKEEIEKNLNFKFLKKNYLITFHPETSTGQDPLKQITELLTALSGEDSETLLMFTHANADSGSASIIEEIQKFVSNNKGKAVSFSSMGQKNYLSALNFIDLVIGNSSSGIIEVPSFKIPTINIGSRQDGRLRAPSVLDVACERTAINKGIKEAWRLKEEGSLERMKSPFEGVNTASKMAQILKEVELTKSTSKPFYDLKRKNE